MQYRAFWAATIEEEASIWSSFVGLAESFPDAPIYHYGKYERKAFRTLAKRHGDGQRLGNRLVNVAASVYGKVYFPVRSNGLKVLGAFIGSIWSSSEASGLQSLVWRYRWEKTRDSVHMQALLQYNREDCEAVKLLVERLAGIKEKAAGEPTIDFADHPKQPATDVGIEIHRQFEWILWSGQDEAGRGKFHVRSNAAGSESTPRKRGAPKGHKAFQRITPSKAGREVRVPSKRRCPHGHGTLVLDDNNLAERMVIDLVFTQNGCRKKVTRYRRDPDSPKLGLLFGGDVGDEDQLIPIAKKGPISIVKTEPRRRRPCNGAHR